MSRLPNIKKAAANKRGYFDQEESDVDDDGNPLTISAALRVYHKDEKTKTVYCPKPSYDNPLDSLQQLNRKKAHIQELLQKARVDQLQRTGHTMGQAVKTDMQLTHMPIVRVLQRPSKPKYARPQGPTAPVIRSEDQGAAGVRTLQKKKTSTLTVTQPERSRINYQALTSKAQKSLAQQSEVDPRQFLPGGMATFDPPQAHHRFHKEDTALRAMYNHIVRDKRHSYFSNTASLDPQQHQFLDVNVDLSDSGSTRFKQLGSGMSQKRSHADGSKV